MKSIWKMAFLSTVFVLASCKGGGGGSSAGTSSTNYNPPTTPTAQMGAISGTAATGAPLARADVTIRGDNCTLTTETNSAGVFSKTVGNCEGPYLITVRGTKGIVHSVIDDAGKIANVNPITTIIAARVLDSADLENVSNATIQSKVSASEIAAQVTQVKAALAPILSQFGAADIDPVSSPIEANGQGLDRVLDALDVKADTGAGNLVVEVKGTNATVTINENGATPAPAPSNALNTAATTVSSSMDDLDLIQTAINGAASGLNPAAYCTADFKEWGDSCTTYFGDDEEGGGYEYKITRPSIVEKTGDAAWVSFDVLFREKNANMDWIIDSRNGLMQMKKLNGTWKLYGNQIPHPLIFDATGWKYTNNYPSTQTCVENGYTLIPLITNNSNNSSSYGDNLFDLSYGMTIKINDGNTVVSVPFNQMQDPENNTTYLPSISVSELEDAYKPCGGAGMDGGGIVKIPASLTGTNRFVKVELGYKDKSTNQVGSKVLYTLNPYVGNAETDFSYDFEGTRSTDQCFKSITGFKNGKSPSGMYYSFSISWDKWADNPWESQIGRWESLFRVFESDVYPLSFPYAPVESNYRQGQYGNTPYSLETETAVFSTNIFYDYENFEGKYITRHHSCTEDQTP